MSCEHDNRLLTYSLILPNSDGNGSSQQSLGMRFVAQRMPLLGSLYVKLI